MGVLKEFRDFAVKGNVIDLAVGVIIGGAFVYYIAKILIIIIVNNYYSRILYNLLKIAIIIISAEGALVFCFFSAIAKM